MGDDWIGALVAILLAMLFAFVGGGAIGFILGVAKASEMNRKRVEMRESIEKAYKKEFGEKETDA